MPQYRRRKIPGGSYFFTVVTKHRLPILTQPEVRAALRKALLSVHARTPFSLDAMVLLPDHMHAIWTLPANDSAFASRWRLIKTFVTKALKGSDLGGTIWQHRYWEHALRDDADFARHVDYVHWNPIKHGLVQRVADWPWSTFYRDLRAGIYTEDWCGPVGAKSHATENSSSVNP